MKHLLFIFICITFFALKANSTNNVPEPPYHAKRIITAPVIDGKPDDACRADIEWAPIDQVWIGSPTTSDDYTGMYKVVWTPSRLFVLMKFIRRMINDDYISQCDDIYDYECAEIFLDEDHSGGSHQYNYNAFSYHMTTKNDVCEHGPNGQGSYTVNDDVKLRFDSSAGNHTYYWEVEVKVFNDGYVLGGNNTPVTLTANKKMGFSVAYNTNDGGNQRKNMFGSHYLPGPDKNTSWINASDFGDIILDEDSATMIKAEDIYNEFRCYPNPANNEINIFCENGWNGNFKVQLYNLLGKEVKDFELTKNQSLFERKLNLADLPKGIYFIKISNGQKLYIHKISLQ